MSAALDSFSRRCSENLRPRTLGEHRAEMARAARIEVEKLHPSYPPALHYLEYPKRCPCGALVTDHEYPSGGLVLAKCERGHSWKELPL